MAIQVKGIEHEWGFDFYGDPKNLEDWRSDGLDVSIVEYSIPAWAVGRGLTRVWCFAQDVLNFRNPWRK